MTDALRPPGRSSEDEGEVPFALVWFHGTRVPMNEHQFEQAVRKGLLCQCKDCLDCRALEYAKEHHPT